jgi:hypothetical protein
MTLSSNTFSLGLTYWQRRTGFRMWQSYDRGAAREELAHVAALGCDTLRLCLLWEAFQPAPERVDAQAMRHLEHTLDAAYAAGLRVALALFPVAVGGALHVPYWANGPDVAAALRRAGRERALMVVRTPGLVPVLTEAGYRPAQTGDLFSETSILEAQRYLIRETVGYFGAHPATWAWQLGEGFERVHLPAEREVVQAWFAAMADEIRRQRPGARVLGVTSVRGLERAPGPHPEDLAATCDLVGVAADPQELGDEGQRRHTSYAAFLNALVAGLAGRRALVTSLGMPGGLQNVAGWVEDQSYGRSLRAFFGTPNEQAAFVDAALERLYRAGAAGAWLASYADSPEESWRTPPLDRSLRQRALGLVDAGGREKPAAEAVRSFAASLPADRAQPHASPPALDPERYWHAPRRELHTLWREFNTENGGSGA